MVASSCEGLIFHSERPHMWSFCYGERMFKLDEKKIRKGKPIGLPYQGSKKKISKKIVEIIKQNFGTNKPIYDIFGGGGAITAECMLNGSEVHYNDLDKDITDMGSPPRVRVKH